MLLSKRHEGDPDRGGADSEGWVSLDVALVARARHLQHAVATSIGRVRRWTEVKGKTDQGHTQGYGHGAG